MTQQQQQQNCLFYFRSVLFWDGFHNINKSPYLQRTACAHENDRTGIGQVKFKKIKKQAEKNTGSFVGTVHVRYTEVTEHTSCKWSYKLKKEEEEERQFC